MLAKSGEVSISNWKVPRWRKSESLIPHTLLKTSGYFFYFFFFTWRREGGKEEGKEDVVEVED